MDSGRPRGNIYFLWVKVSLFGFILSFNRLSSISVVSFDRVWHSSKAKTTNGLITLLCSLFFDNGGEHETVGPLSSPVLPGNGVNPSHTDAQGLQRQITTSDLQRVWSEPVSSVQCFITAHAAYPSAISQPGPSPDIKVRSSRPDGDRAGPRRPSRSPLFRSAAARFGLKWLR